jgi:hypothetical protein
LKIKEKIFLARFENTKEEIGQYHNAMLTMEHRNRMTYLTLIKQKGETEILLHHPFLFLFAFLK